MEEDNWGSINLPLVHQYQRRFKLSEIGSISGGRERTREAARGRIDHNLAEREDHAVCISEFAQEPHEEQRVGTMGLEIVIRSDAWIT